MDFFWGVMWMLMVGACVAAAVAALWSAVLVVSSTMRRINGKASVGLDWHLPLIASTVVLAAPGVLLAFVGAMIFAANLNWIALPLLIAVVVGVVIVSDVRRITADRPARLPWLPVATPTVVLIAVSVMHTASFVDGEYSAGQLWVALLLGVWLSACIVNGRWILNAHRANVARGAPGALDTVTALPLGSTAS